MKYFRLIICSFAFLLTVSCTVSEENNAEDIATDEQLKSEQGEISNIDLSEAKIFLLKHCAQKHCGEYVLMINGDIISKLVIENNVERSTESKLSKEQVSGIHGLIETLDMRGSERYFLPGERGCRTSSSDGANMELLIEKGSSSLKSIFYLGCRELPESYLNLIAWAEEMAVQLDRPEF